jgi:hypothetical protein
MTRAELTCVVRRYNRYRTWLLNFALMIMLGAPWIGVYVTMRPGYSPDKQGDFVMLLALSALVVPLLVLGLLFLVLRRLGIRCPHCQSFLGLEKKKFYDVTVTGRCRKCGRSVIDDVV